MLPLPQEYASSKPVTIHYPPSQYLDDSARRSVLADLPGLRLAKNIQLQRESRLTSSAAFLAFRGTSQRLLLRIHNKVPPRLALGFTSQASAGHG